MTEVIETLDDAATRYDQGLVNLGDEMTTTTRACSESCPEPVAVTVVNTTVNVGTDGVRPVFTLTPDAVYPATKAKLLIEFQDENGDVSELDYAFLLRFVDSSAAKSIPTPVPPTAPGWPYATLHAEDGQLEVDIENSGSLKYWYPVVDFAGLFWLGPVLDLGN